MNTMYLVQKYLRLSYALTKFSMFFTEVYNYSTNKVVKHGKITKIRVFGM